tara:strand:- start:1135 stop:2352 length:1218 start_codon:yes stop_codon:yes gene_type:complete
VWSQKVPFGTRYLLSLLARTNPVGEKKETKKTKKKKEIMSILGPRVHAIALNALRFPGLSSSSKEEEETKTEECVASLYNSEQSRAYRELVLWLEHTKIRRLPASDREGLLGSPETKDDQEWSKKYAEYLRLCECDDMHLTCAESKIDFLINLALAEEYRDRFDIETTDEEDEEEDHEHEERARTPTEKMRGMEINKWSGENRNSGSREDVMMMDANVEDVGSAEKRTKVENEKGFAYSRCKSKDGREEKERMTNATDSTAHTSPLLADLREKQEALEDAETYDALMKVLDTFEVVPSFETKRPMVDERLVRLVTQTLERFVVPFEDDGPSSKKSDLKLSDEDYILRDSGVPIKNPKVKRMVDALRVMYVNQLRVTQDRADDILLQVQSRVADPRTDSKQGRVGR